MNGAALPGDDDDGMPNDPDARVPGGYAIAATDSVRSRRPVTSFRAHTVGTGEPRPGERCSCCGVVVKYTTEMMLQTMELCAKAGLQDCSEVLRFVKARTPFNDVRRQLAQRAGTIQTLGNPEPLGKDMTAEWDKTVADINALLLRGGRAG